MKKFVFVIGNPMVGKSTICSLLSKSERYVHIGLGAMIRSNKRYESEIAKFLAQGQLIPSEMMFEILNEALTKKTEDAIYLLDGFPRSQNCLAIWRSMDMPEPYRVLYLTASVDVLHARRVKRELDESRSDDKRSIFERRLALFDVDTMPVLDIFKHMTLTVASDRDAYEIVKEIEQKLKCCL